jgi:hypothetical protein
MKGRKERKSEELKESRLNSGLDEFVTDLAVAIIEIHGCMGWLLLYQRVRLS